MEESIFEKSADEVFHRLGSRAGNTANTCRGRLSLSGRDRAGDGRLETRDRGCGDGAGAGRECGVAGCDGCARQECQGRGGVGTGDRDLCGLGVKGDGRGRGRGGRRVKDSRGCVGRRQRTVTDKTHEVLDAALGQTSGGGGRWVAAGDGRSLDLGDGAGCGDGGSRADRFSRGGCDDGDRVDDARNGRQDRRRGGGPRRADCANEDSVLSGLGDCDLLGKLNVCGGGRDDRGGCGS